LHWPVNHLLSQLNANAAKNVNVEVVFSSLQNLKNTYKYTFESSNMLSKSAFNLFYLTYYLYSYIFKNIFNFIFNPMALVLKVNRLWKDRRIRRKLFMNLNNYIFFSKKWCLCFFNFMVIRKSVISTKKKRKRRSFFRKKSLRIGMFTIILLQKLCLTTKSFHCWITQLIFLWGCMV
jgi:hypothetical protein